VYAWGLNFNPYQLLPPIDVFISLGYGCFQHFWILPGMPSLVVLEELPPAVVIIAAPLAVDVSLWALDPVLPHLFLGRFARWHVAHAIHCVTFA